MKTPICDFVIDYVKSEAVRLHMPGHKGENFLGFENSDITEICGADSLYEANGIIKESEKNGSAVFGCPTFYSTEGSSQCIRAMMFLISKFAKTNGNKPLILAGRNAHKTFISAAAMIDFDIEWIYPQRNESYLSCKIDAEELDKIIRKMNRKPDAVYLTNPDYLGNCVDIGAISQICHKHGILLSVDNAHGAYLRFLSPSLHPIDLGADICCDSAHKTLPVLTGGAYLHISEKSPEFFSENAKNALSLFGSTSPSYLILQSLDAVNRYISDGYSRKLSKLINRINELKSELKEIGYEFIGDEPLKLTFDIKKYGYSGYNFSEYLKENNIYCEFYDPDYVVFMFTPEINETDFDLLKNILLSFPKNTKKESSPPEFRVRKEALSVREAVFSESKIIPVSEAEGKILAFCDTGCPPAVPIIVCGEIIDNHTVECFKYYGTEYCSVII